MAQDQEGKSHAHRSTMGTVTNVTQRLRGRKEGKAALETSEGMQIPLGWLEKGGFYQAKLLE